MRNYVVNGKNYCVNKLIYCVNNYKDCVNNFKDCVNNFKDYVNNFSMGYGYDASGERMYKMGLSEITVTTNQNGIDSSFIVWNVEKMMGSVSN